MSTNSPRLFARPTWPILVALANLPPASTSAFVRRLVARLRWLQRRSSRSEADAIHDLSPRILRDLGLEGTPTRQDHRFFEAEAQSGMFR